MRILYSDLLRAIICYVGTPPPREGLSLRYKTKSEGMISPSKNILKRTMFQLYKTHKTLMHKQIIEFWSIC